jgi:hypothetical protein
VAKVTPKKVFETRDQIDTRRSSITNNITRIYTEKSAYLHIGYYEGSYEGHSIPSSEREEFGCMFYKHKFSMGDWLTGSRHGDGIYISDNGNFFYG